MILEKIPEDYKGYQILDYVQDEVFKFDEQLPDYLHVE